MTPVSAVCRRVFAVQNAAWRKNARVLLRKPTVKAVHDMRVAGRKIRAALKLFRKILPPTPETLDAELAAAGKLLGTARDLDVHLAYLTRPLKNWPEALRRGLLPYETGQKAALETARQAIQRHLKSRTFARRDKTLASLPKGPANLEDRPASRFAEKRLKKIFRKLQKQSARMKSDPTDVNLHRFRRAVRRMRYAALFFESVGKPSLKKLVSRLGEWQDVLGDRQDRLAGSRLVIEYLNSRTKALPLSEEKVLIQLVHQLDREKEQIQEKILLGWTSSERKKLKYLLRKAF